MSEIDLSEIDVGEISATEGDTVGERPIALAVGAGAVWVANEADATVSRVVPGQGETTPIPVGRGPGRDRFRVRIAVGRERRGRDRNDDRSGNDVGDGHQARRREPGGARGRR